VPLTEPGARLFFSAGDTSGDQHAARLLRRLRELLPGLQAEGLGGPELAAAGCTLHADLVASAIVGLGGAVAAVPEMLSVLRRTAAVLDARRPDAVILVDYPGLNLFVARVAHRRGIPVVYFVAPQLWGWAPWRARRFARVVDEALVLFPFEVPFFGEAGLRAVCIGHPLLDGLPGRSAMGRGADPRAAASRPEIAGRPRPVALLPGSRPREVAEHVPVLLEAARALLARFPDASFHSAHVSQVELANLQRHAARAGVPLQLHDADVHGVMASCRCAAVGSGTATLETALFGTPMVVVYHFRRLELALRPVLMVPPWFGIVNLLSGREVCPEVIFARPDPERIATELAPLMEDTPAFRAQRDALDALRRSLLDGQPAGAVERAAQHLLARLRGGRVVVPDPTLA
jgi:lipid-A-disaccharide synthase